MEKTHIRQKLILSAVAGMIMIPGVRSQRRRRKEVKVSLLSGRMGSNRYWRNVMRQK